MTALELWALVRKGWLILVLCAVAGVGVGAGISSMQPRLYSATTTGYVVAGNSATVGDAFAGSALAAEKAGTYLPLVGSRSVAERVAEDLGLSSIGPVRGALEGSTEGVIFRVTATAESAELATRMADAAIRATSVEANALETLTVEGDTTGNTVVRIVPVEPAQMPSAPVSPDWTRNMILGLALGLMAGLGLLVARHALDRRVRQMAQAEEAAGVSGLGIVPMAKELAEEVSLTRDMRGAAEAVRELRTNLRFVSVDNPVRSMVITSSNAGEGKSTIAAHLASMLADSGQPTVLIDADLRRPVQAGHFGVDGMVGLSHVLAGSASLESALVSTGQRNLQLLPAGRQPPNPSELLGSERMRDLIARLSGHYIVIIDAPPLLPVTDAALLTTASDGALIVVQSNKTRTEQLHLAAHKVSQVGGTLLGVVLNMVAKKDLGAATFGYGYGSYSPEYYYTETADHGTRSGRRRQRRRAGSTEQDAGFEDFDFSHEPVRTQVP